jgi:hypothetical protein
LQSERLAATAAAKTTTALHGKGRRKTNKKSLKSLDIETLLINQCNALQRR